jgi:hypothetical protein
MTSSSKTKGNSWEREIAKFLGDTLGGNFQRTPGSGAYVGGRNIHRKSYLSDTQQSLAKGDIIPPDNLIKLNLEAKNYKDIAFHQIIDGSCSQLDAWIDQTEIPANDGDISFTIFKITRKGSWIVFKQSLASNFSLGSHVVYKKSNDTYIVTTFKSFVIENKESIIRLVQIEED